MKKTATVTRFICQECGAILSKWAGQCDVCRAWNSIVEEVVKKGHKKANVSGDFFTNIGDTTSEDNKEKRHITNINELNRVLGGGFVEGSVVLVGGPPGIGKSTLLLQMLLGRISEIENYIYISAEESVGQVSARAIRLGRNNQNLKLANSSDIEQIIASVKDIQNKTILVIDSIQTVSTELIQSSPVGSISQIRYCTQELINIAKKNNIIVVIVGHITKDGAIAGPKTLEHMVDTVLYFEGDRSYDYRILRGAKNRYGPTDEIGVFSMTGGGLEEIDNPSSAFLSDHENSVSGVAVFSGIEGTRPILSEIQALVSHTSIAIPRRSSIGFDSNRLSMLVAVLSTRCRLNLSNKDVYLNVAGGLKISEPAIDLAVASSIISAAFQRPLPNGSVFFGEISLSGEIRQSHLSYARIREAQKLGFTKIYCSYKTENFENIDCNIEIVRIRSVKDVMNLIRG